MLTGMYIFKYKEKFIRIRIALLSLLLSIVLYYFELPFSQLFGGIAIFIIAMLLPLKASSITNNMRKQSMWIYYLHMYFMFICFETFRIVNIPIHVYEVFAIVSVATFITTGIIVELTNKGHCEWLNKLIR
jgi:hypothetical protein